MLFTFVFPSFFHYFDDLDLQCKSSVGMENGEIPHRSIDASSTRNSHYPYLGRLNNQIQRLNETKAVWGAWCAEDSNTNQYIQVYINKHFQ